MARHNIKGLRKFITSVLQCPSKEAENERVSEELAHIRDQLRHIAGKRGYDLKKFVAKLMFISLLGHNIDFGFDEMVRLTRSRVISEKVIGYLAVSMLCTEKDEGFTKTLPHALQDLEIGAPMAQSLTLHFLGQTVGPESAGKMVEPLSAYTRRARVTTIGLPAALMVLARCVRVAPDRTTPKALMTFVGTYSSSSSLTVRNAAFQLLLSLLHVHQEEKGELLDQLEDLEARDDGSGAEAAELGQVQGQLEQLEQLEPQYMSAVHTAIAQLHGILTDRHANSDYHYFHLPFPWHVVTLLKAIRAAPCDELDSLSRTRLEEVTKKITVLFEHALQSTKPGTGNHRNIRAAMFSEALAVHTRFHLGGPMKDALGLVGKLLTAHHTNTRLLALELLESLAQDETVVPRMHVHMGTVLKCLEEPDISIRKRAVDALFVMASHDTVQEVVSHLLAFLGRAEYRLREEVVLRVAELVENYSEGRTRWYIVVVLCLVRDAPDSVTDDIWFRATQQLRESGEDDQLFSAVRTLNTLMEAVARSEAGGADAFVAVNEPLLRLGAHFLGTYGPLVQRAAAASGEDGARSELDTAAPLDDYLALFLDHFPLVQSLTRSAIVLLTAKLLAGNLLPRDRVLEFLNSQKKSLDPEVQQRTAEFLLLLHQAPGVAQQIILPGPGAASAMGGMDMAPAGDGDPLLDMSGGGDGGGGSIGGAGAGAGAVGTTGGEIDLLGDLLGGGDPLGGGMGAGGGELDNNKDQFPALLISSGTGTLFEDSTLTILYRSRVTDDGALQALVDVTNKLGAPVQGLAARLSYSAAADESAVAGGIAAVPNQIMPGQTAQIAIQLRAAQPALLKPVQLVMQYSAPSTRELTLDLPIVAAKWLNPLSFTRDAFLERWRGIPATQELKASLVTPPALQSKTALLQFICGEGGLRFQSVSELTDALPLRIAAAAVARFSGGAVCGALLGIEGASEAWDRVVVTIRTTQPTLGQALANTFLTLFSVAG